MAELDDFPEVDKDKHAEDHEVHHVELKACCCANLVASPGGCCGMFWLVIACWIGCGVYIAFNLPCLSTNFSDLKVINSDISNNWYQKGLSGENAFEYVMRSDDSSSRRRLMIEDEEYDEIMGIASSGRGRRRLSVSEPTPTPYGYTMWTSTDFYYRAIQAISLNVFFYAKNTNNILTNELLTICHKVEKGIKDFPLYHNHSLVYREKDSDFELLFGNEQLYLEATPGSFLSFIFPQTITLDGLGSSYVYNGNGDKLTLQGNPPSIENTIRTLNKEAEGQDITEFFDFGFNFVNVSSKYLAAIYPFGYQNESESKAELYAWVGSYRTEFFEKLGSDVTDKIGMAYADSRNVILSDEIDYYLGQDLNLAIWSIVVIYIVVYLYCRSLYITTLGLLGVLGSFLGAFASYDIVWGESFSIVNMVAVWVILGIGCDDICVFISSYRRAPLESVNGQVIPNHLRLAFAYREAGSAMFVTSFTTSCSFFSLCLSTINPLPQFGYFLGVLVLINFALVMSWFPCILQSYVWWVMFTMKHGCFIPGCTKWLAVAVPLPEQYDIKQDSLGLDKQKSMIVVKRSSSKNNALLPMGAGGQSIDLDNNPIDENEINGQTPLYGRQLSRQQSSKFAVPGGATSPSSESIGGDMNGSPGLSPGTHASAPSLLVRQLTRKLDKNSGNDGGFSAETQFGDCTNLYFVIMRRGLGVTLILIVLVLTCVFAYTATLITLPEETVVLLPEDTNFGQVSIALENMDIDESQFGGYSQSTGESTGSAVVTPGTNEPTPSPVPTPPPTPKPTRGPTNATPGPTNPVPTTSPITKQPTPGPTDPTTAQPTLSPSTSTTQSPTPAPTSNPTPSPVNSPTRDPTPRPTPNPTPSPTPRPSPNPTDVTITPSQAPTPRPSDAPVQAADPTNPPTGDTPAPTPVPTPVTSNPTERPTKGPSESPTTAEPSPGPSRGPSAAPTTATPTDAPTTADPTKSPSGVPSASPTTAAPTDEPTKGPSATPTSPSEAPSQIPTVSPTPYPTFIPPDLDSNPISFECINPDSISVQVASGGTLTCSLGTLRTNTSAEAFLWREQIAFVFEGPQALLYGNDAIAGCGIYNNASVFYDDTTYISEGNWSTKWCYKGTDLNAAAVSDASFTFTAPYISGNSWFRISIWLFLDQTWQQFRNEDGDLWYNYSVVNELSAAAETLSVDESITIYLLFGTLSVTDYTTDCESGEVTSGSLTLDSNFDIYSTAAQQRWMDLCDALNEITDIVMYRDDDDQEQCFGYRFWEYTKNASYPSQELGSITNNVTFNDYLTRFVTTSQSDATGQTGFTNTPYDPKEFDSWFGTKTNAEWHNDNASVAWVHQIVRTQINEKWGGPKMWEYYTKWQDFMDKFNAGSPASFQGIQTSSNYIRMEVEVAFLDGFVKSVLYTIILCAIVMVFFTQNLYLVILVCLYILIICIWVVGLFGAVGWPFGIIEIISVPTVVGLTIDYALHITHAYIHSPFPDRLRRAKSAVNDLGSSVFASAMTTISSMLILYFATIIIFSDLGWVVGSTTTFGVALALFVCPPCLMYTGPEYDQCHFTWCCPADKNGIQACGHTFCSNEWHGNKKGIAKEHNEAIELEVQKNKQDLISDDIEGTGGPKGYDAPGSIPQQPQSNEIDNNDDNMEDELPSGWRACLTDDGKVYYQNDITQETSWKKPEKKKVEEDIIAVQAVQASAPSDAYEKAAVAVPLSTSPVQSEPDPINDNDIASDLPPSYQPPSADLHEVQQAQYANAEVDPEPESEPKPDINQDSDKEYNVDDAVDDLISGAYLIPPTKGDDNDGTNDSDEQKSINQVYDEQANIMQQIGSEASDNRPNVLLADDDDEDGYVPPAPAPPAYQPGQQEDEASNKEDLMAKMATPKGDNNANLDDMNLEESLSLPIQDGDNDNNNDNVGGDIL